MSEPLGDFLSKWSRPPVDPAAKALQEIDFQRISVGKRPLDDTQTQVALQAARTRKPVIPEPDRNPWAIPSNIATDITDLVKGIPQIPMALLNAGKEILTEGPLHIPEGGNIADSPILRLLPGAFVASAILPGGAPLDELAVRPVSTALDLLPFGSKAVEGLAASRLTELNPKYKLRSPATAEHLRMKAMDQLDPLQLPRRSDRMAVQAGIALGEGKRLLPNLATYRLVKTGSGRQVVAPRPWRIALQQSQLSPLLQFAEDARNFQSFTRRSESKQALRAQDLESYQAALGASGEFLDFIKERQKGKGMEAVTLDAFDAYDQIREALDDFTAINPMFRTPDEARSTLPADLQPWFDRFREVEIPRVTQQALSRQEGWADPVVAEYNDNVYPIKQVKKMERADANLAKFQSRLETKAAKFFEFSNKKLVEELGQDVVDLARRDPEAAKLVLKKQKYGRPVTMVNAIQHFDDMQARITRSLTMNAEDLWLYGVEKKLNLGKMENAYLSTSQWGELFKAHEDFRRIAQSRRALFQRSRPAAQKTTGSRIVFEKYMDQFQKASQAGETIPHWDDYRSIYLEAEKLKGSKVLDDRVKRLHVQRQLREELGDENYRLLHYTVAGDPQWFSQSSTKQWRESLRKLVSESEYRRLVNSTEETLANMSLDGFKPEWVPRLPAERVGQVESTSLRTSYLNPRLGKDRTYDYAPTASDLGISVAADAMEDFMARVGIPEHVKTLSNHSSMMPEYVLREQLTAEAEMMRIKNPLMTDDTIREYVNEAMGFGNKARQRYVPFDPSSYFEFSSPTHGNAAKLWIPKEMHQVLEATTRASMNPSILQRMLEPLTNMFRSSVLLYSPQWQMNSIMSNNLVGMVNNPSYLKEMGGVWRDVGGVKGLAKRMQEGDLGGATEVTARPVGNLSTPEEMANFTSVTGATENYTMGIHNRLGKSPLEDAAARGSTGRRLWDSFAHSPTMKRLGRFHEKTGGAALGLNTFFDDMARRANFRALYNKAETKYLDDYKDFNGTPAKGEVLERLQGKAAVESLEKVQDWFMDWSQLLPIERGFIRAVFPFYSFTSHALRAAVKLPFDHPMRVAITNSFTRAEQEDWMSGYPPIFRTLLGMPMNDDQSEFIGLNVNSFNPFRDVGNLLTLGGLLSASNPALQVLFEQLGVDPMAGGPEYAPNFVYDPRTGFSRYNAGNAVVNLAMNLVPQAQTIARYAGMDAGFRELRRTDPETANRMLASGMMLPTIFRKVDVNKEIIKTENRKFNDLQDSIQRLEADNVARYNPELGEAVARKKREKELENATAQQLASMIVGNQGGPPANPLSAFVTV
jgi:hypothetical protein